MNLVWTPSFTRMAKRLLRQNPQLRSQVQKTLVQLANDPFHPTLKTHKLKGELSGRWSCSIDYSNRIVFKFGVDPDTEIEEIVLLAIGLHDAVY